jgi:hypothetical protein
LITLLLKLGTQTSTESRSYQIYSLPFLREKIFIQGQNNLKLVLCMTLMQSHKTLKENPHCASAINRALTSQQNTFRQISI